MKVSHFRHEAMATFFELAIAHPDERYAQQAAATAFRELDRLEDDLSRFVESSDIARASRLGRGESVRLGEAAFECLLLAADVALATHRAFDPAYGSLRPVDLPVGVLPFTLDPATHTLASQAIRLSLDLGAMGKGYALDRIATLLREWEIEFACLNSGGSTVLAFGAPPDATGWPVALGEDPAVRRSFPLANAALSGSGTAVKGAHLIEPRTGKTAARNARVWALAPTAAVADAHSTAFFIFGDEEISAFCTEHPTIGAAVEPATISNAPCVYGRLRDIVAAS
jgi:thiamine biosynthesis lipoprotein